MTDVHWLGHEDCHHTHVVGGKAASLSRLAALHTVPTGFAIPALDANANAEGLPRTIAEAIRAAYARLAEETGEESVSVAVRFSAIDEDAAGASFAGQHDTYLNVRGHAAVLEAVTRCRDSAISPGALAYRKQQGISIEDVKIGILVQQLVASDVSAIIFSHNPINKSPDEIVINASWGLGESLVGGTVTPIPFGGAVRVGVSRESFTRCPSAPATGRATGFSSGLPTGFATGLATGPVPGAPVIVLSTMAVSIFGSGLGTSRGGAGVVVPVGATVGLGLSAGSSIFLRLPTRVVVVASRRSASAASRSTCWRISAVAIFCGAALRISRARRWKSRAPMLAGAYSVIGCPKLAPSFSLVLKLTIESYTTPLKRLRSSARISRASFVRTSYWFARTRTAGRAPLLSQI